MPLYPDYLYGGNSSSFSSPYYSHASTSSSPPSSPYSRVGGHWPIIGYSPLTALLSANISSLNTTPRRSYTPYLSSISEKTPALGRHLFTNRHSPKSKLLYYKSRPVTINTENINLSKDNVKEKKDSVSMSGPIQRGKTVVRMHTKKLKENPGLKKVKKTPGAMLMEKFLIKEPPKEDTYNWREEYNNKKNQMAAKQVSPVRFTTEEEEEKVTKNEDEPMVVDELPPSQTAAVNRLPVISSANQQRRMSITDERLQEEAAILDSLIQEEMKEGQKKMEVRRRRKSADLLEEDPSSVVVRRRRKSADLLEEDSAVTEDTSAKKTAKKKYVRQPSGERSSRTLPLDLVEIDERTSDVVEDLKKSVKKRPTVKRKNPLKIVVNEITVEEKVEPKPARKLNYEVIVEESKEDSNDEEVVTKVFPRPRPSLAIKRRATIKRMFSRDKEALAARSENTTTTQEPKTEKPSDLCSKPSENQEDVPPPVIYRTEFFLKGEDPILEEPEVDIKEQIGTSPTEDSQMKPTSTKIDNKLSGSASNIDETNKVQASVKPLAKFPFAKDSQQKVPESTDSKLSDNGNKLNKDQSSLKPFSKFPFAKQVKVPESSRSVVQDTKLKNQLNDSKAVEHNEKKSTAMEVEKNDGISEKKAEEKMKTPESSSVIEEKPLIPPESAKSVESPPVTYRSEFVLWGSTDKTDQSEEYKTKNIEVENSKSLFNSNSLDTLKSSTTEKIDPPLKQDSKTDIKMRENSGKQLSSSASKQLNVQRPKLDTSPKSSQVNQNSRSEEVPTNQSKVYDKSEVSSDDKVPKKVEPEEKPTTTEKRKQSIYGDVLVKNDNIKIFGIQVKSDVAPKVNETKIDLKTPTEKKTSDTRKVENLNGMKKNEKTVIPQFLNKNRIEANAKNVDEESKIQKKDESSSSFLKKNVLESKPLIVNKTIDKQSKEQLNGDVSLLKTETSSTESQPVEKVQKRLPNVSTSLTKTDKTPEINLMEKSSLLKGFKALNDGKNTGDTKKETLSKPEDSKITNQLVKPSSASSSLPEVSKKTVVDDKNDGRLSKDNSIQDKNTQSVPDKVKSGTSIQEKSKMTKSEEAAKPSLFGMKTSIEKTEQGKSDKEKVKPSLKLMNGGKLSISQDKDSVNGVEEKHLLSNLSKVESSNEDDTSEKKDGVSSPESTSVLKNQEVSIPTTIANQVITEVEKDSSKKLVGKTKEKSVTKIASPIGTKKGSKEAKKEDLTKDVSVSTSGVSLEKDNVSVKECKKVEKLEEKTVVVESSKKRDNVAEKKIGVVKPSEKTSETSNSKEKKDVTKPVVNKKDVNSGEEIFKVTNSGRLGEEKLEIEEGRMTVRRRMTKHKTNLSETRMSLMKLEEKKRKESEVKQVGERKMTKENLLEEKVPKIDNKVEEDVKVEVVPVNEKENEEDTKKEEADEDEDTETEGSSEEEEESTEVESSSEYESDGSAESRERSSGSPLRHLSDTSLGVGGLDEVTTTEVSRCRVTPPATSLPRFRKYSIQDFQFLKVLGKGSFGKVLLAELSGTECYYAVKCLKKDVVLEDDDVECTLIERKVLALGTNHPYLCHLFCTFQTESHLFFVMEYLNGGDLMFHIQQSGRFDEGRARFYASEIVSGLMFLHKKGIVYRDLKLDNILLDFDGHVRIADFGMCKLQIYLDRTADTFCGTPDYMAPEIIKGLAYNQCVDWWSFGILLYEMLVGQSPFSGCDEDDLFWSICNEQPHYPRFLSKESKLILSQLLEKDSSRRLGSSELSGREVTSHVFFRDWDWFRLERRLLDPPFKPRVRHPLDVQYFDKAFTNERPRLTPIDKSILQSMDQTQFQGFSYTNPNVTK